MNNESVDISIIIVNWNTLQLTMDCIASVYETVRSHSFEIIVVDNASSDDSAAEISARYPSIKMIKNERNEGFARSNNTAMKVMRGAYAVLLNSDTRLIADSLDSLIDFMDQHPRVGVCGPQLLNSDGSRQDSYGAFSTIMTEFLGKSILRVVFPNHYKKSIGQRRTNLTEPTPVDFVMGACMVVRKHALGEVGLFDENFFFLYEENDWCFRMHQAGWHIYHLPSAEIYHFGGQSLKSVNLRARAEYWRSRYLFFIKHNKLSVYGVFGLYAIGISWLVIRLVLYGFLNVLALFSMKRMRQKFGILGYLLLWHLRGFPLSMCLPR